MSAIVSPPVVPLPQRARWAAALQAISAQPLELCPQFPKIARRFEAWWAHDAIDRPLFCGSINTRPQRPITKNLELLEQPERWLEEKIQDLKLTHRCGDFLPRIRADFGPVLISALLSPKTELVSDTTWVPAYINDDWSNAPQWKLPTNHPWWKALLTILARTAGHAKGKYLVCTPDLGGSGDVLLNLRGSSELCMDAIEQPERIEQGVQAIYPIWWQAYEQLYVQTVERGAGLIHWLGIWSDQPYMIPACDFNFMIGPAEFERLLLPDISRQAATAGRAVFHLDGPGAARHIDALLEVPEIDAIQYTPGEGTNSALPWLDMFRKVQTKGRSLVIIVPIDEAVAVCEALSPKGLLLLLDHPTSVEHLEAVGQQIRGRYGTKD
jgi:hypothetical protein